MPANNHETPANPVNRHFFLLAILAMAFMTLVCNRSPFQKSEEGANQPLAEQAGMAQSRDESSRTRADAFGAEKDARQASPDEPVTQLAAGQGLRPIQVEGRLLEYMIHLEYKAQDLTLARQFLFAFITRHGFLLSSSANQSGSLHFQIRIQASELYKALEELDELGELLSENIQVTDHTENNVAQEIKRRRSQSRSVRRQALLQPGHKDLTGMEELLAASEDAGDAAELELWRIKDRVKWATLNIKIEAPQEKGLEIPPYERVLLQSLQGLLYLIYYLLYLLPFVLFFLLARFLWRSFRAWRKRRKEAAQ